MRSGFSLIELLVVVAIIGLLSAVGLVAYQTYIETTRDEVAISDTVELNRIINVDHTSITSGINARSSLADGITNETRCKDQVDKIVYELNTVQTKTNPHNKSCGLAFSGNRAWLATNYQDTVNSVNYFTGCDVNVTADTVKVPRGRMMVACVNNNAKIDTNDYKLFTCMCTGEAECETTNVISDCLANSNYGFADNATCHLKWFDHASNKVNALLQVRFNKFFL